MLQPLSDKFLVLDRGLAEDLVFVPKAQIQAINFDRATNQAELNLAQQPTIRFTDSEANIRRTLAWRDVPKTRSFGSFGPASEDGQDEERRVYIEE